MINFLETLKSLGPGRLAAMAGISAATIAFFIYLTSRLASPEMALLYGDLDSQDSGQIIARLEQAGVPYEIGPSGDQIYVPGEQVARMRVAMAEEGLPSGGSIGYEIFDRSEGLGVSSFVQNINHLRALEGELSRTIRSIGNLKQARVHLVLPRRELFSRDRQEPSASIVVTMEGNSRLDRQQVLAIQHLVAAAVPGLQPTAISIVDNKGTLLARTASDGDLDGTANTAEEMRAAYEARMARALQELLERSVGPGNATVEVSAEMDFDRITENAEIFDPDGQVVRSTQTVEESEDARDGQGPPPVSVGTTLPDADLASLEGGDSSESRSLRTEETVNYEISKTVRTHVREAGLVRRLSIAVLVNGSYVKGADGEMAYQDRTPQELEQLTSLVRSAAGYDEARGDTVEIVNLQFAALDISEGDSEAMLLLGFERGDLIRSAELLVLGIVAVLLLIFVVRPLLRQALDIVNTANTAEQGQAEYTMLTDPNSPQTALAGPNLPLGHLSGNQPALAGMAGASGMTGQGGSLLAAGQAESLDESIEAVIDINRVDGQVRASSLRKINEIVENHPEDAASIVRSWLYQD